MMAYAFVWQYGASISRLLLQVADVNFNYPLPARLPRKDNSKFLSCSRPDLTAKRAVTFNIENLRRSSH